MRGALTVLLRCGKLIPLLFFLLCVLEGVHVWAAEPIKVGAVLSLTGWAGRLGTPEKEGLEIVVDKVNGVGGVLGRPIEVYYEDDQSNPTNSVIAATKLIRDKKVSCLIGGTITAFCMPIIPICENEHVPNLSLGAGHEITVPLKKWVFRIPFTDYKLSPRMLQFVVDTLGARKIALLYGTDSSGTMGAKGIMDNMGKYNASIIISETFDVTDTSMIPQLTKIKAASPDVVILYTNSVAASVIAKNYQQLGMSTPVVGSSGILSPEFTQLAGKIAEGNRWIIFGVKDQYADRLPPDDPYRKNLFDPFKKALKERYNREYNAMAPNSHDAMGVLVNGLKIAGTDDRAALRDGIEKAKYEGILASYSFSPTNHDGNSGEGSEPLIIRDGKMWPYEK
ncbi:MAG: ABC transporter substrate-binding protein [Syntrophorhabdales bacterium]|jgi:branched-chain amino acid transport system substrate-binding protein